MTDPLIEIHQLTKSYATPAGEMLALRGIDVQVMRGEFVGVIGKSGSGKSTFINMLTGIDRPSSGQVHIGGVPIHTLNQEQLAEWRGRNLGIVFQFFQLLPMLTLVENVMLPMDLNNLYRPRERRERAMHLLELVELQEQAHKLPAAVSGGQQQRTAIARALANDPPLLVADEPTGNLDSKTAAQIFQLFRQLAAQGKTIVMVTHDDDLAQQVDRTIAIADGQVINEFVARALSVLSFDQLVQVKRSAQNKTYAAGTDIVRQGEAGHEFYILLQGGADVFLERPGSAPLQVDHLEAGQYFGELALLTNAPRSATVRAAAPDGVTTAVLDAAQFQTMVAESPALRQEFQRITDMRRLRTQLQTFAALPPEVLDELTRNLQVKTFAPDAIIFEQGSLGSTFYVILHGEAEASARKSDGTFIVLNRLHAGQFFGEMAMLGRGRRSATVRAVSPLQVIELSAAEFSKLTETSDVFRAQLQRATDKRSHNLQTQGIA